MDEKKRMQVIAENITYYRKQRGITQKELAIEVGITPSTMTDYMKLRSAPSFGVIQKLADYFGIKKSDIDTTFKEEHPTPTEAPDSLLTEILDKVAQLSTPDKTELVRFTSELLEREEADRIIQEEPLFKIYFRSAAKAGPKGYGYDDYDADYAYTDQKPPRHDVATKVDGNSMNPDYQDGDILYLRDYGASHYNGEECVVVINDKSYFKRLYTTEEGLRLVSTNPNKATYPDIFINFPPTDGSHIKIFDVVGSFTPLNR
ncbi:TPA: helix-turn-helix domain-containing protein [Streptococcus suis]|nr:helix-turn-helix domain-containing protein [Streptococcus suis]